MTTYIELPLDGGTLTPSQVADTNSIDLTVALGVLTGDLRLSSTAAGGGFLKVTNSIDSAGLLSLVPIADTSTTGVLSDTDWDTFNNKPDNVAELAVVTDGTNAPVGTIGQIISDTTSPTTANVAASGSYGWAADVSLTAGVWEIQGLFIYQTNGADIDTSVTAGISSSTSGSGLDQFNTVEDVRFFNAIGDTQNVSFVVLPLVVSINSTTTYYLNSRFYYGSGTPRHGGRLQARRIR
jgi:hypothetical protein